ncbi:Uncharacterized protein dnm_066340 [Desulfonema magnum]|uniref:Uncharacterized protein n=1 Tax=Desulfonema magnum TaxID=45655 RepID=A0A975BRM3_9BACT|nr:Uncharacterized protein dnm_066340 [Desulfonema magnum]
MFCLKYQSELIFTVKIHFPKIRFLIFTLFREAFLSAVFILDTTIR